MSSNNVDLYQRSLRTVPGGVHSPVRSFKGLSNDPIFIEKAYGPYIEDVDGKTYIDFCMSFGPLILGHANSEVSRALKSAIDRGWSYGACEPYSLDLADYICSKIDFIDKIRFVNSGTEAVMTALRLARAYSKKNKVLKFDGCYHGHVDSMLIKAGSGLAGESESSSAGVSKEVSSETFILDLGDEQGVKELFAKHGKDIGAIIIEPLPANNGLLPQDKNFLEFLRKISTENESLLIFDEVISGFRMSFQGMSGLLGITPDIVTYGKVIGGGLPVGAIAGKSQIMDSLAPLGPVYQAGTLSANPLAMVGGLETLQKLDEQAYEHLEVFTSEIVSAFNHFFQASKYKKFKMFNQGSLFWLSTKEGIKRASEIPSTIMEDFDPLFQELLERGIYLAPNPYEVGFVSLAHNHKLIEDLKKKLG